MQHNSASPATLLCAAFLSILAATATAQITVTSPTNGSTWTTVPVQLTANVSACAGSSNVTLFEYSINSSPLATPSPNNGTSTQINTTEYRLSAQPSPGAQYTIRFKAWSDAGACAEDDVNITVTGAATTTVANIDDLPNADPPNQASTDQDVWFYVWDSNTDCCMESDTSSYTVSSPALDGQSRLYYADWMANSQTGTPGERYSLNFGDNVANESKTHFIYDTYIYVTDPENIQNLEMDTNQVWNTNGAYVIYGLQCAGPPYSVWQFTTYQGWISSSYPCNPQTWAANQWHHVQIAVHTTGNGNVYYDSVTLDGNTTPFSGMYGNSSRSGPWAQGLLSLNFQLDGINNGEKETTITAYTDGFTMIYW